MLNIERDTRKLAEADGSCVKCAGGHINPAVTFGLFLARKVSLIRAILYMVAQCLGAICGVGLVKAFQSSLYNRYNGGANMLADGYNKGTGLGAEIIGTFVLVYTVFSATDPKRSARDSHVPVSFDFFFLSLILDHQKKKKSLLDIIMQLWRFHSSEDLGSDRSLEVTVYLLCNTCSGIEYDSLVYLLRPVLVGLNLGMMGMMGWNVWMWLWETLLISMGKD